MAGAGSTLRIAMVAPFGLKPKGSMAVRALPLARALAERGHAVKVIMPAWHTPTEPPRTWQDGAITLEYVSLGPFAGHASAPWIMRRMVSSALAWRPDIVHAFKPKAYAGLAAWALWQRRCQPGASALVVDEDDWEGRGGWEELEPYSLPLKAFFRWQERWGLTHCHAVTVASRALQTLVWSLGVRPEQVTLLPNGSTLPARDGSFGVTAPVVLLYTRFAEFAPERAAATFAQVATLVPGARLRVVGRALHAEHDAAFDRAVASAGLTGRVERLGWLEPEELPSALTGCRVAIFPFDDTLVNRCKCPVKLADLLRLGIPVVADDVGEVASYVADGETGFRVPGADVATMASRTAQLLVDNALAERMSRAAQQRYAALFDWRQLAVSAETAYVDILR